ncbi:hypothetical protein PVAND_014778 [Polypedilum vanderplanki]|uniref:Uncharacterized protein n=1 Tax=Polypedilum vanderplanki TaxID=319348 RepID=A0A9J6BB21_POLVA|nr:hypothetical protein PVAND_014778 [Polypedilum vanderplanki]
MKFSCLFIFILSFSQTIPKNSKKQENFIEGHRFKSVYCKADNISMSVKYCYIKAYSRIVATLNFGAKILKPLRKPFFVKLILYYRYGTIARPIIETKEEEWCSAMNGGNYHLYLKMLVDQLKGTASNLFRKCPYDSDIDVKNVTIDFNKALAVFNAGIYRCDIIVIKDQNPIMIVNTTAEIKSQIKYSFG